MGAADLMTLSAAARALCLSEWRLRDFFVRGVLPEPSRVGTLRAIRAGDLERYRRTLIAAGILTKATENV